MPAPRPLLLALTLLCSACASFDGLLRAGKLSEAQDHVETDADFRRLLAADAPDAIPVHIAALDRDAAIAALRAQPGDDDEPSFRAFLERRLFVSFLADADHTRFHHAVRWRLHAARATLRDFVLPRNLVALTGEREPPDGCHEVVDEPLSPTLAEMVNRAARRVVDPTGESSTRVELMQERARMVTRCATLADDARVAPRAAALSVALSKQADAAVGGRYFGPGELATAAVAFDRPVDGAATVVLCAYARSWEDRAQLAVRYELRIDETSLPRAPGFVPIGRVARARSAVLVTETREHFDGDRRAAECLEPQLARPAVAARIRALQAAAKR